MMTPTRIVRLIGVAGLVGWMVMVGWVAKTSQAQNGSQNPPNSPASESKALSVPQAPAEATKPAPAPVPPPLGSELDTSKSDPSPRRNTPPPPVLASMPPPEASAPADPGPVTPAESHSAATGDDPEQSAQSFVERNQKEAEEHLKALTTEAQQLRTRLAKLESGIKKWQGLVNALKSSQGQPVVVTSSTPGAEDAGDLEPIKPGGVRNDKRVKWATATSSPSGAQPQPGDHVDPAAEQPQAGAQPQPLPVAVPGSIPR